MSETLSQAETLEAEFERLATAETLDDERIGDLLEGRDALHRKMIEQLETKESLGEAYRAFFKRAYNNTQDLLKRCQTERESVQEKLITLNTSKKARKAY